VLEAPRGDLAGNVALLDFLFDEETVTSSIVYFRVFLAARSQTSADKSSAKSDDSDS